MRAQLVLLGAEGEDPVPALYSAAADRELDSEPQSTTGDWNASGSQDPPFISASACS